MNVADQRDYYREFIDELRKLGELLDIKDEVDPHLEMGAIMSYANTNRAPAQHFTNVKGVLEGMSFAGGLWGNVRRMAVALGLSPDTDFHGLADFYGPAMEGRLPPVYVDEGKCQQNVYVGDDVDLTLLPAPFYRPQDGGPYIGTINVGVTKDPDSDWINWGTYRGMLHDRNSIGTLLYPFGHGGMMLQKYHDRGIPMEMALFYGGDPVYHLLAGAGIPANVAELEVAGAIRNTPVELVKCKTIDIFVPANAELVIEGMIRPGDIKPEGPFGEYPGYVVTGEVERPVFRVSGVTHRDDPIVPGCVFGAPIDDSPEWAIEMSARIKSSLLAAGVPVDKVAIPDCCGNHAIAVSTKTTFAGIPQLISKIVWADRNGRVIPHVIVVNDDVDPASLEDVFHAWATKCNPARDIYIDKGSFNSPLTPFIHTSPLKELGGGGGNVLYDCTWPIECPPDDVPFRLAFENTYPEELKESVKEKAKAWGLIKPS